MRLHPYDAVLRWRMDRSSQQLPPKNFQGTSVLIFNTWHRTSHFFLSFFLSSYSSSLNSPATLRRYHFFIPVAQMAHIASSHFSLLSELRPGQLGLARVKPARLSFVPPHPQPQPRLLRSSHLRATTEPVEPQPTSPPTVSSWYFDCSQTVVYQKRGKVMLCINLPVDLLQV